MLIGKLILTDLERAFSGRNVFFLLNLHSRTIKNSYDARSGASYIKRGCKLVAKLTGGIAHSDTLNLSHLC